MKRYPLLSYFVIAFAGIVFIATFAIGYQDSQAEEHNTDYSKIDSYVQSQMDVWHIPGVALVIVQGREVVHLRGLGVADSTGRLVTPQTPFEIGSCTKSFTALAILQLAEQAQVELDAPIQEYLSWFRVADPDAAARITIRHLLNQTSGISQSDSNKRMMINPRSLTLEQRVRTMKDVTLTASPGTSYQYSNLNYVALALIIETVTGKSYGEYLKESIFAPLKMENSFADVAEARRHGLADGHTWWFGLPFKSLEKARPDMLGAGYLMVSPEDMAHYLIAQVNMGRYDGMRVLSMEDVTSMHTPAQLPSEQSDYGMGWMNFQEDGETVINHNGQSASFTCSMILLPDRQTGIAVMANVSSLLGPQAAASLAFRIKDMLITGQPAQVDPSYRKFFVPWNIGFLLSTTILFWSFAKPGRRNVWLPFVLDGFFLLAACLGLPLVLGWARWRGMFVWQPDAVYWCLAAGVLLSFRFLSKALLICKGKIHV